MNVLQFHKIDQTIDGEVCLLLLFTDLTNLSLPIKKNTFFILLNKRLNFIQ